MAKPQKQKKKKQSIFKNAGFYFVLIYAILAIALIVQAVMINVIPIKYIMIAGVVLFLIFIAMYALQMGEKINKINRTLGKILIVIMVVLLGMGNWYLFATNSALAKMTNSGKDISVISVVVMEDSPLKEIEDLKGQTLGTISIGDTEAQESVLKDIEKDMGTAPITVEYKSYKDYGDDLYEGNVDAILVNEGSRGLFEENHKDFDTETRVIKEYTYEREAEDISKNVDVTEESFNVYITGIDTYGTLATVSRSDVNMIVSVNPKTHQILMTGIPRDFYIPQTCQGNQRDKLTHTGIFGVDCTIDSVENYMGIDLNYYARVNFSSVVNIVDALGGITVESPYAFTTRHGNYQISAGLNELNGAETLGFVRERYALADGDRERSRNQMRVVEAMINKALSPAIITNYTSIMGAISDSFQTNMSQKEMTSFIRAQIDDMSGWDIKQIQVSGEGTTTWSPANGFNAYVMIPDEACVQNAVKLINKINSGEVITDADVEYQNSLVAQAG